MSKAPASTKQSQPVIDTCTEAFAEFRASRATYENENWSEADTRSKWIDKLLIDCLGWTERDIRREVSHAGQRLDYQLSPLLPCVVVEAKKASISFPIVPNANFKRVQLKKLLGANPSLKEHLDQAAGYCHTHSIPYAVVTNGRSLIVFNGHRDDRIPLWNGDAVVLSDLFAEGFDFATLHMLLSRESVQDGSLSRAFANARPDALARSVLSSYTLPDASIQRDPFSSALEPILGKLFTDVVNDRSDDILLHCYVKPGEARLRDVQLEEPLLDQPPVQKLPMVNIVSRNAFDEFEQTVVRKLRALGGSTVLVVGNVGVGKSIFLRRFFSTARTDRVIPESTIPFFVDFRLAGSQADRVWDFLIDEIYSELMRLDGMANQGLRGFDLSSSTALQKIFYDEMARFSRSAMVLQNDEQEYNRKLFQKLTELKANRSDYVVACLRYMRNYCDAFPCVILDNADHHDEELQRRVYLAAKQLQGDLDSVVLVSLQEAWYWHFKDRQGPLAAYQDTVFHVPAPRVKDVLAKRLDYALAKIEEFVPSQLLINFGTNMALEPKSLEAYLRKCKRAFFENDQTAIAFECLSNGNVRHGLDLFCVFVRSGHNKAESYLLAVTGGSGAKSFSEEQMIQAIAKGDFLYYSGSRSSIPNLFTEFADLVPGAFPRFGALFVLMYLATRAQESTPSVGRGYVGRAVLADLLGALGVASDRRDAALGPV